MKNVTPYLRTSGRKPDAENRRRSALVAPLASHGPKPTMHAFEWNSGMTWYMTSSRVIGCLVVKTSAILARRPCEQMHAFGAPLVPEVNNKR